MKNYEYENLKKKKVFNLELAKTKFYVGQDLLLVISDITKE